MTRNMYLGKETFDLELDERKNLKFTSTDSEWLSQKIESNLGLQYGEWFLNRELGFPYFEEVLKKNPDFNRINTLMRSFVLEITGVKSLVTWDSSFDNTTRKFSVSFTAEMDSGELVQGEI